MKRKEWQRFELKMPPTQRAALDTFADELGMTPSALIRFAVARLIQDHDLRLPREREAA